MVGVVGLGGLGRGIVACCLARGFTVVGIDREQSNRQRLSVYLPEARAQCVEAGVIDADDPSDWQARLELSSDLASIGRACLVIEAIPEHLSSKRQLLQEIEGTIAADVPIGSNTSAFPITALQAGCKHPERIFGMHWSSHGHITRFMELTPGEQTSPETMALAAAMAVRLGKETAVLKKDVPGFLCNRIAYAMYREAVYLLESGVADAASIDRSFRNSVGLWAAMCGPLRVIDVMGGGAFYAESIKGVLPTLASSTELQATLQSFIDQGAQGPKNNIGFFPYADGDEADWARRFTAAILATKHYQDQFIPCDNLE
ncbi:MAG: 3-hydroxyacyl-CoA dehydrogenase family protein [Fuerstiella sp.]|nr:3-hydroxyacyl-CoA dehydrogenase family protein [Fuerstiella sp.]